MNEINVKIFPLGDNALIVSFGNIISPELNDSAVKLAYYVEQNPFEGFIEAVPAYASVSIFYDISIVRKNFPKFSTAFETVENFVENSLRNLDNASEGSSRLIEIPVNFDEEHAPDLDFVAAQNNLTPPEVIEIFTGRVYHVYMIGFLPGFAYMGEIDERIKTPRKLSPRLKVPKGSVGIAGGQTGIYSLESPGGWQIIGVTKIELFTPAAEHPTLLQPGDMVKFYASSKVSP